MCRDRGRRGMACASDRAGVGRSMVETASFPNMAAGKQDSVLAEIQAVGEGYCLRGKILMTMCCMSHRPSPHAAGCGIGSSAIGIGASELLLELGIAAVEILEEAHLAAGLRH